MSLADESKALVDQFFDEVWNKGNFDFLDEVYSPDFVLHALWQNTAAGGAIEAKDREAAKKVIEAWRTGFPDLNIGVVE